MSVTSPMGAPERASEVLPINEPRRADGTAAVVEPQPAGAALPIVVPQRARFDEPLELECGRMLPSFEVAYETYGQLAPDGGNAILVCHAYTSDHHAAGRHAQSDARAGWWDTLIGPGKTFDSERFFVVSSNCLGGSHGTTGAGSIDPTTGRRYGGSFPVVTMADIVDVQARLADRLGITRFHAIAGGCFGGAQVLQWMARHPERLANAIVISATPRASVHTVALSLIGREAIRRDPRWNGGDYYDGEPPSDGIALLTMFGALFWQDRNLLQRKLAPEMARTRTLGYDFAPEFEIERQLLRLGVPQNVTLDANALLYLARANDYFDLSRGHASLAAALAGWRGRTLLLGFAQDWRYPPEDIAEIDAALRANGAVSRHVTLSNPLGHGAFLRDTPAIEPELRQFLHEADHAARH
ncbi:homoserine O-acetyltransferase [Candidatus Binatia bacterium]|jgi:homoserine O-acetyltransferase|nr:homoserine O-acetyltransferase [Candidatus Binatia bacterium]